MKFLKKHKKATDPADTAASDADPPPPPTTSSASNPASETRIAHNEEYTPATEKLTVDVSLASTTGTKGEDLPPEDAPLYRALWDFEGDEANQKLNVGDIVPVVGFEEGWDYSEDGRPIPVERAWAKCWIRGLYIWVPANYLEAYEGQHYGVLRRKSSEPKSTSSESRLTPKKELTRMSSTTEEPHDTPTMSDVDAACHIQRCVKGMLCRNSLRKDKIFYNCLQRGKLIGEIVHTERTYVNKLRHLKQIFIMPLRAAKASGIPILDDNELNAIFSNTETVLKLQEELLGKLVGLTRDEKCISNMPGELASIFLTMMPFFKVYTMYCNNYFECTKDNLSESHPYRRAKKKPKFLAFVKEAEQDKKLGGLKLESYLIEPVQRLPRYQLFFQGLLKTLKEEHADRRKVEQALTSIESMTNEVNNAIRLAEMMQKCISLQNKFQTFSLSQPLVAPHRRLLKSGKLRHIDDNYNLHLFLFNDKLVTGTKLNRYYIEKDQLWLPTVTASDTMDDVHPDDDGDDSCNLRIMSHARQIVYRVAASSPEEKKVWLEEINAAVADATKNADRLKAAIAIHEESVTTAEPSELRSRRPSLPVTLQNQIRGIRKRGKWSLGADPTLRDTLLREHGGGGANVSAPTTPGSTPAATAPTTPVDTPSITLQTHPSTILEVGEEQCNIDAISTPTSTTATITSATSTPVPGSLDLSIGASVAESRLSRGLSDATTIGFRGSRRLSDASISSNVEEDCDSKDSTAEFSASGKDGKKKKLKVGKRIRNSIYDTLRIKKGEKKPDEVDISTPSRDVEESAGTEAEGSVATTTITDLAAAAAAAASATPGASGASGGASSGGTTPASGGIGGNAAAVAAAAAAAKAAQMHRRQSHSHHPPSTDPSQPPPDAHAGPTTTPSSPAGTRSSSPTRATSPTRTPTVAVVSTATGSHTRPLAPDSVAVPSKKDTLSVPTPTMRRNSLPVSLQKQIHGIRRTIKWGSNFWSEIVGDSKHSPPKPVSAPPDPSQTTAPATATAPTTPEKSPKRLSASASRGEVEAELAHVRLQLSHHRSEVERLESAEKDLAARLASL
eukprot:Rmarinus@m.24069